MQSNLIVANIITGISKRISKLFINRNGKADLSWFKIKYLKHAQAGVISTYRYKNKKIYYSSPSELLHTLKEIFIEEIYKVNLAANAVIIDCGANIGLSVIYFKEHYPLAEIIAFEPDTTSFQLLKTNVASFNLTNVTLREEAVWTDNTTLDFSSDGTMGSKILQTELINTSKVKATRLKDLLNRKIDFLKIDIEGAEFLVLQDIKDSLHNVSYLFLEYHGNFNQNNELTEIFNILQTTGFSYYIKEAANIFRSPFMADSISSKRAFDVQLNLFCFRIL